MKTYEISIKENDIIRITSVKADKFYRMENFIMFVDKLDNIIAVFDTEKIQTIKPLLNN